MGGGGLGGGSGGGPGGGLTLPNLSGLMNLGKSRGASNPAVSPMDHARVGSGGGPLAQQAVKAALTKLGHPYVFGATGPNAFDCSGLVQWSYAQAGVTIGRDTRAQIGQGFAVDPADVTVGDAIFPTKSFGADGKPGPGHVMLAISPTQVIEAQTESQPIKISPMPASFVARRYVT
ncbi:C40 family peptidase, partial [Mycobacteroides abscessus]